MIKAYFISDLHIGADESKGEFEKQKHFLKFLDSIYYNATHLYIVGDLFDFWFEYKYVIPKKYFEFLCEFKKLVNKGVEIHYLTGNHDFYLGVFFDEYIGIKTWPNDYEFELGGKKFYLFHGDGLAKKDTGYRILKRILRNKCSIRLYRWLHPDLGIPLARLVSGSSRKYTNQINNLRDESDYIEFAEKQFERGADYVIMGHRHNPLVHEKHGRKYLNLGDWIEFNSYGLFDGKGLELKYYKK
jgi:UDP-2,3-diacylglucosamine hydrolase